MKNRTLVDALPQPGVRVERLVRALRDDCADACVLSGTAMKAENRT
jgi:hypothetical protein